ncbi:MAG: class I SAM-dependent methyltransferase [Candidatus Omnitrophota bacterium]|jgi:2-polyprenyl-3-methyl-5-hydroxy-6-metoxy-1,4-benzoquinol methylase|nr:MAG: class I SAM-dependent methyltransferase [Candidatus Omnitrophota bacterium]
MRNPVCEYYDQNAENEWRRLVNSPYRRMEFEVIHSFLNQYLPASGKILDLGGGPGRYTISLARRGYRLTLVDLSQAAVNLARDKIHSAGVAKQVDRVAAADARCLDFLPDASFDAVLCMGPLYHLPKRDDRISCLRECARVMKPNATLFATIIPRWSFLRDALRSHTFLDIVAHTPKALEEILATGTSTHARVPDMYFCRPEEIREWLNDSGIRLVEVASTHGLASFMDEQLAAISKDVAAWNALLHLVLSSCTDPGMLASAEYLLTVGKK